MYISELVKGNRGDAAELLDDILIHNTAKTESRLMLLYKYLELTPKGEELMNNQLRKIREEKHQA